MTLSSTQFHELSQLIDEIQSLAPADRIAWLDRLEPDRRRYRPALEPLATGGVETRDFLATLPRLDLADATDDGTWSAGTNVGPYRLVRELGKGGMGAVWLAERTDGTLQRPVALKLPHALHGRGRYAERFARERDILAGLAHPNIARLYDAGVAADGQPWLALEVVEGEPLGAWCDARALPVAERLALFAQVLAAVQYAHGRLVVHRDLKPANILVTAQGEVKLLDFGIAKLLVDGTANETELTQLAGRPLTPRYASPEQLLGQPIGIASDVYSLGVVLHELLCGGSPYRPAHDSRGALEEAILRGEPVRPGQAIPDETAARARGTTAQRLTRQLAGDLDTIALKALKKQAEDRYPTVDALAADLRRHLEGEPVQARPDSAWYRTRKFVGRNRLAVGAGVAVVLALGSGLGVALWQAAIARDEARNAEAVRSFLEAIFTANTSNQVNPQKARQTTARELLDIGAARLDTALKDVPEARAAALRTVSDMYAELGLNDRAAELGFERIKLLRTLRRAGDPDLADQLVDVSQMLQSTNRSAERAPLLHEALAILDRDPGKVPQVRLRVLRQLALLEQDSRDPAALDHAQQAVVQSELVGSRGEVIDTLMVLGKVQTTAGDHVAAEATLARAAALAEATPDFHRRQRVLLIAYLGDAQIRLGKYAEAEDAFRKALAQALEVSGPEHIDVVQTEKRLAELLFDTGRTGEGMTVLASARARTIRVKGPQDISLLPAILVADAQQRARYGHIEEALAIIDQCLAQIHVQGPDRRAPREYALNVLRAQILLQQGRSVEARRALDSADEAAALARMAAAAARERRAILGAQVAQATGDPGPARALLAAPPAAEQGGAPSLPTPDDWDNVLARGELALALGEADVAAKAAAQVLAQIATSAQPGRLELPEQAAAALAGRAALVRGDATAALPPLRRAVELAERRFDPQRSLALADALAALGRAAFAGGDRDGATRDAQRAAALYRAHPALDGQFLAGLAPLLGSAPRAAGRRAPTTPATPAAHPSGTAPAARRTPA